MEKSLKQFKLFGGRTIKTGISVFLTALICSFFNLPVVFAVITAVVTIEHTAFASIRKAAVRFPASALGAMIAVSMYSLFGKGALTFGLAAMLTIGLCHKLNLDDGIVVATITAIAMIPDFQGNELVSFVTRLGTTSIGIVVSTLVNFFLLPPNYTPMILQNLHTMNATASQLLRRIMMNITGETKHRNSSIKRLHRQLTNRLERTDTLLRFQREEWKYHRHSRKDLKQLVYVKEHLSLMHQLVHHLGNMAFACETVPAFSETEKELLTTLLPKLEKALTAEKHEITEDHFKMIDQLDRLFWKWREQHLEKNDGFRHHFAAEVVLVYELLSFHDVLEEMYQLTTKHRDHIITYGDKN
ncbi:aromatic acid exporter family protein [Salimicrobium sp. PL1-032A]|uniref:FUSC family protein n=1 Tax=Salimicrobium sp. PL1-032A TaxID=3095364 RepID=UPI003260D2A7